MGRELAEERKKEEKGELCVVFKGRKKKPENVFFFFSAFFSLKTQRKRKETSLSLPSFLTSPVDSVVSMPRAAHAIPYIDASENDTKMAAAMQKQGMIVDLYPRARPKMMSVAAPVRHASATSWTGE